MESIAINLIWAAVVLVVVHLVNKQATPLLVLKEKPTTDVDDLRATVRKLQAQTNNNTLALGMKVKE